MVSVRKQYEQFKAEKLGKFPFVAAKMGRCSLRIAVRIALRYCGKHRGKQQTMVGRDELNDKERAGR